MNKINTLHFFVLFFSYIKTLPGLLKLAQLIVGAVCVGIIGHYYNHHYLYGSFDLFFLLMATTFLIGTFCLLVSCLISLSTGGIISKTIYVYHFAIDFWKILNLLIEFLFLYELGTHLSHDCCNPNFNRIGVLACETSGLQTTWLLQCLHRRWGK